MYTRFLYPKPVANGLAWFHAGAVVDVAVKVLLFPDESANGEPETADNNKLEFDPLGANGMVGVVETVLTTLEILKLLKYPVNGCDAQLFPIVKVVFCVVPVNVPEPTEEPFEYAVIVFPDLVTAM